jgi:hypothetical protein
MTDIDSGTVCVPLEDVLRAERSVYYIVRTLQYLADATELLP